MSAFVILMTNTSISALALGLRWQSRVQLYHNLRKTESVTVCVVSLIVAFVALHISSQPRKYRPWTAALESSIQTKVRRCTNVERRISLFLLKKIRSFNSSMANCTNLSSLFGTPLIRWRYEFSFFSHATCTRDNPLFLHPALYCLSRAWNR